MVERTRGTMQRLRIAPVSLTQILAGKALACFSTVIAISLLLLLIAYIVFKVIPASVPLLALAVVSSAIGFTGIMMLLSVLGRTERSVAGIGWAVLLIMSMLGRRYGAVDVHAALDADNRNYQPGEMGDPLP